MARDDAVRLDPQEILAAYELGYFPMARSKNAASIVWVLPEVRGVLPLDKRRAPRKLKRFARSRPFDVRVDTNFVGVIRSCAEATHDRPDTWINDQIVEAYSELHFLGAAHSVECYEDGALVGGLYGVAIGGVFFGESMFSRRTNASKIAMLELTARLAAGGFKLLDTQFYTEHLSQFGVVECDNASYQYALKLYRNVSAQFPVGAG